MRLRARCRNGRALPLPLYTVDGAADSDASADGIA
ncbi:hypothetical protein CCHR01_18240 [Colletotrichum chrysophilum]|uniref:Uncharacterized protein n=1 Tax=Colletotrichum chrysophilum TaxID=1836956 RepID=A0AAD9A113_9PEZI|nr:hypothetical protein CCHR01_18240 [Colletotrichum chrysophilum]